jgi:iron complex outermembrane recepter protein
MIASQQHFGFLRCDTCGVNMPRIIEGSYRRNVVAAAAKKSTRTSARLAGLHYILADLDRPPGVIWLLTAELAYRLGDTNTGTPTLKVVLIIPPVPTKCRGGSEMNRKAMNAYALRGAMTIGTLGAIGGGSYASAQDQSPSQQISKSDRPAEQVDKAHLAEIIVTAERVSTRLQDTPLAITAFDGGTIERIRVQSVSDLVPRIPGFSINSVTRSRVNPALRGGSSSLSAPASDQAVALFVDEVYYGSSADFDIDLFDIERVEVLRGPQGTLFGRNSTGGSIAVVTKEPSSEAQGGIEASVGNYDMVQGRGFMTGPLNGSESLLGSLAFTTTDRSGTSYSRARDTDVDTVGRTSVRGKLKWLFPDGASLLLSADYSKVNETGEARDFLGPTPQNGAFVPDNDSRVTDQFTAGGFRSESWGLSSKFEKQFGAGALVAISAYRHAKSSELPNDMIGSPSLIFAFTEGRELDQFTQEVRFASELEGRFNFVGGVFYLHQNDRRASDFFWQHRPDTFAGVLQALSFCQPDQGFEFESVNSQCLASRPELFDAGAAEWFQKSNADSYAAFLQGKYQITPEVTLTAGGRYTIDRKTAAGYVNGDLNFATNPVEVPGFMGTAGGYRLNEVSKRWNAFTPRVTIDWKAADELMFYVTASRGYRSGAYQLEADATVAGIPLEPEFVWNYEAGLKSRFFDNTVQANLAAFDARYSDLQFQFTDENGQSQVDNAGRARVRGIETELIWQPVRGLNLGANYSYQTGEVRRIPEQLGLPQGIEPAQMPKHSLNLTGVYSLDLANGGDVTLAADMQYKSEYQLELNPDPAFASQVKNIVNANISYRTPNQKWQFTLWGKNLTDEDVVIFGQDFRFFSYSFNEAFNPEAANFNPAAATSRIARYAPPRTYGVTARFDF